MKRTWTFIGVADVPATFQWYQSLLGLPPTSPAHPCFGQILDETARSPPSSALDAARCRSIPSERAAPTPDLTR